MTMCHDHSCWTCNFKCHKHISLFMNIWYFVQAGIIYDKGNKVLNGSCDISSASDHNILQHKTNVTTKQVLPYEHMQRRIITMPILLLDELCCIYLQRFHEHPQRLNSFCVFTDLENWLFCVWPIHPVYSAAGCTSDNPAHPCLITPKAAASAMLKETMNARRIYF